MARRPRRKNLSVEQFKQLMAAVPKEVRKELAGGVHEAGQMLVAGMKQAVPTGIDGRHELLESIRMEEGRHLMEVAVRAGGPLTTREVREGAGVFYDYALANEFGTQEMNAQPFFWPVYRLFKKKIRSLIKRRANKAMKRVVNIKGGP